MKFRFISILLLMPFLAIAQQETYLFSYFVKNGEDGLHFAYSTDGLTWEDPKGGNFFLKPTIGKDKLMRDLLQR